MNFLDLYKKQNLIAAHRGARSLYPENTLAALKVSIGHCDFIEVDMQLSSDGIAIITHDYTLSRVSNVASLEKFKGREPFYVNQFNFDEIKSLDFDGEPILTLDQTLQFAKEYKAYINIEIKDIRKTTEDSKVMRILLDKIKEYDVEDRIMISSFRHEYLKLSKELNPYIPTAALVEYNHPKNLIKYLKEINVDSYNISDEMVDESIVKMLKENGFSVNVYTINDIKRVQELFAMGVNGIFTDKCGEIKKGMENTSIPFK